MLKKLFAPLLAAIFLFATLCPAQDIHFTAVPRSQDDIGSVIIAVTQDSKGYIWFATQNGLYKYDGSQYTAYHNQPSNPNSLILENIECVAEDNQGFIWVGHYHQASGLERLDPSTGIFTHFHHDKNDASSLGNDSISCIKQASDGTIWVGTNGGLDRYDSKTNTFFHYRSNKNDSTTISSNQVRVVYEDKQGIIWVGCGNPFISENLKREGGLNKLNTRTGKFTRYLHKDDDPNSLTDDRVRAIYEDSRGNFWVGSASDGLHKMDREKGSFERLLYDPAHPQKLSRPPVQRVFNYATDHITFITEDVNGRLWICTFQGGINVYDPATKKISHFGTENNSTEKIPNNSFWTGYKARDGIIWLTTWGSDLYKINPYQFKVPYQRIDETANSFAEDRANTLWMGTYGGLFHLGTDGKFQQFLLEKFDQSTNNQVNDLVIDNDNRIWTATLHGLYYFDPVKQTFTGFHARENGPVSILSDTILTLAKTMENQLWVGTYTGLELIDPAKGTLKIYRNDPKDSNSISSDIISFVNEDSKGNVWVGCYNGLNRLNKQTGTFKKFINQTRINQVYEDREGNLWAATSKGLYKYDLSSDNFLQFTRPTGVLSGSQSIFWVLADQDKNLWLNTNRGIVKLNIEKDREVLFGKSQGISAALLNIRGILRSNDDVLFAENSGYYIFNNTFLQGDTSKPTITINSFLLKDIPLQPTPGGILTAPLEQTKEIRLAHDENTFSIEFSNIDFVSPHEDTRLLYMLENYDTKWRPATDSRNAYYFNLPPGKYIFKVKAFSSNGASSQKEISIIISPPWWLRWWAYCIYGFLAVVFAFSIHRYQKARFVKAERERARVKELAQAKEIQKAYHELRDTQSKLIQQEKMASLGELTAGIAHEIQNPLNFVNNFSDLNKELITELKEELKNKNYEDVDLLANDIAVNEDKINHHGRRADSIVKGMLQHSRSSTGQKESTDINKLADEYLRLSYHGLRAKDISFNSDIITSFDEDLSTETGKINVNGQDIGRVILNLVNNAFYAVNEKSKLNLPGYKPTVTVTTKRTNKQVELSIADNGNGIPQKIVDKIFQPFFTTKPTGQGTGLGLSLSYDIVKAHGGEIKVVSKEGEGTDFIIQLPFV